MQKVLHGCIIEDDHFALVLISRCMKSLRHRRLNEPHVCLIQFDNFASVEDRLDSLCGYDVGTSVKVRGSLVVTLLNWTHLSGQRQGFYSSTDTEKASGSMRFNQFGSTK